jgi:hypothetical protein
MMTTEHERLQEKAKAEERFRTLKNRICIVLENTPDEHLALFKINMQLIKAHPDICCSEIEQMLAVNDLYYEQRIRFVDNTHIACAER